MVPVRSEVIEDIIQILEVSVPGIDGDALRAKLNEPLDQICQIKSLIGVDIATQLAEKYDLPSVPRMKLRERKDYVTIKGLVEHIEKRNMGLTTSQRG